MRLRRRQELSLRMFLLLLAYTSTGRGLDAETRRHARGGAA